MGYVEAALAVAAVVTSAVGTGMSMYSQQQAAETAERQGAYNAAVQRNNADIQARMAQYQAGIDQQVAMAQYDAQQKNADAIAGQANAIEAQGREQARRQREEQERMLAVQRGKYAKAGLVNEGSPLVVLADTARLTELNIQDAAYEADLNRSETLRKAELERYQSGFSLLDASLADYRGKAADVSRRMAYRQADLAALAGGAQAAGLRSSASASLISGIGSTVGTAYDYYNKGAFSPRKSSTSAVP